MFYPTIIIFLSFPLSISASQHSYTITSDHATTSLFNGDYSHFQPITMEDDDVSIINLPFSFPFFGSSTSYAYLSSNGVVSFSSYNEPSSPHHIRDKKRDISKRHNNLNHELRDEDENYMVVLHRSSKTTQLDSLVQQVRTKHDEDDTKFLARVTHVHSNLRMFTIRAPSKEALEYLNDHENVFTVHRDRKIDIVDYLRRANDDSKQEVSKASSETSSKPYSWGLDRIDQSDLPLDLNAYVPAQETNLGAGMNIYVVDTGLDASHTEFSNTERTVENIFNAFGSVSDDTDDHGHGTHCAGTVAGKNVGVAPLSNLYGVKVLSGSGSGSTSSITAGLDHILGIRLSGNTAPMVVSLSLGGYCGSTCDTDSLNLAVAELTEHGIHVVVAAGNSADDACLYTPASAPSAITVGSTTITDDISEFSSFGSCVDIFAPGSSITSACASQSCEVPDTYSVMSGTSMATPHVAGVAALWLSQTYHESNPASVDDIMRAIQCSARAGAIYSPPGKTVNLILQSPTPTVTSISDALCDPRGECEEGCSGNGECAFGMCICNDNYFGPNCETYFPQWLLNPFSGGGSDLSDADNYPYSSLAFMWTDLDPSSSHSGNVYYGAVNSDSVAIVFENIVHYGYTATCAVTVEVLIHSHGAFEVIIVSNDIGDSCGFRNVSIGIKGPSEVSSSFEYEQLYGPSISNIPSQRHIIFTPL